MTRKFSARSTVRQDDSLTETMPPRVPSWRTTGLALQAITLVAAVLVSYIPAMRGGFIWDDDTLITANPLLQRAHDVASLWLTGKTPDYLPLTSSMFWLEWHWFGASPGGYHVVNIVLHAAGVLGVWGVLCSLDVTSPFIVAMLFAITPINAATVAWISEGKNTLSLIFYAASTWTWLAFDERRGNRWLFYALSILCFLLALLSKASGIALPLVFLACAWWRRAKLTKSDVLATLPFFALSTVFSVITIVFQRHNIARHLLHISPLPARLLDIGHLYAWYWIHTLLPWPLMMIYPSAPVQITSPWPWIIDAAVMALFYAAWKHRDQPAPGNTDDTLTETPILQPQASWGRGTLLALVSSLVLLLPILGIVPMSFMIFSRVSDHFVYLASIPILALAVATAARFLPRSVWHGAAACITLVAAMMTWQRAGVMAHTQTLWKDNLAKNPHAWVAHSNLGNADFRAGRIKAADRHFTASAALYPYDQRTEFNLGVTRYTLGDIDGAIQHQHRALELDPAYPSPHNSLGLIYYGRGQYRRAQREYEKALALDPDLAETHNNLGVLLVKEGQIEEAIDQYREALRLRPYYRDAFNNLANLLILSNHDRQARALCLQAVRNRTNWAPGWYNLGCEEQHLGKLDQAARDVTRSLALAPHDAEGWNTLGRIEDERNHPDAALTAYKASTTADPGYAQGWNNQAWIMATSRVASLRNGALAVTLAEKAVALTNGRIATNIDTLAAAQAEKGDFERAVSTERIALATAVANQDTGQFSPIRQHLEAFERHQPWRE